MAQNYKFTDGRLGAALPVRVTPRASRDEVVEVLNDQTVRIRLISSPEDKEMNAALLNFLSGVLSVPAENMEVVAGVTGRDKLVSILDIPVDEVHRRILGHLS